MRKDSAKRVEETYWTVAPPSGHFGQLRDALSGNVEKHTHQTSCDTSHRDKGDDLQ